MNVYSENDRKVLRDLAKRVAEIADDPGMDKRRKMWVEHNSLRSKYPMMLIFPEGSWGEIISEKSLTCTGDARWVEAGLRRGIYTFEHFSDDTVIEKEWLVYKTINNTGWGLESKRIPSDEARGAWHFDPVLKEASDLKKIKAPIISFDEKSSLANFAIMQDLFGDILDVRLAGVKHISYHLMAQYTYLRGLEETMIDMYENPQMIHDAMAIYESAHRGMMKQYIEQNLLNINNDGTYQNSGGNSYTDQLPAKEFNPQRVRPCDMWASAEAQEMAQVSPEQHNEFVLQYEKRLLEPFGLTGYGCCEDLTRKLDYVLTIPHIRRISISPWSDLDLCASQLKGKAIFSWKPNPAHLVGNFDTGALRKYVGHAVRAAADNGCFLEMILKDTHTCEFRTERFDKWTQIAREVIADEWK